MRTKRLRMFAGPNGSGKSYLINQLKNQQISVDPVVNSDELLQLLRQSGLVDLNRYGLKNVTVDDWNRAIQSVPELTTRLKLAETKIPIRFSENFIVCNKTDFSDSNIQFNAYVPALISDFIRYQLVDSNQSFSFETVMSHRGKLDFLNIAKENGYKTYLYYLATDSVTINIQKVQNRVMEGGHDVPKEKIIKRYSKSLELLFDALQIVDRAYLIDTSRKHSEVILEKNNKGEIEFFSHSIPYWIDKYVYQKLVT